MRRIVRGHGAHHLKRQLRHAVAELRQFQILKHHIGDPAIGRCVLRALNRLDQRVGFLILGPGVNAQVHLIARHLNPVGPDPPHAQDLPPAQRNRQRDRIAIGRDLGAGCLAPARGLGALVKARGPNHLTRDPRAPVDTVDRRALACAHQAEPFDLARLDRLGAHTQNLLVDHLTDGRAHRAPDHHARQAQNRSPKGRADPRTHSRQNNRRHHSLLSGNAKLATARRAHDMP